MAGTNAESKIRYHNAQGREIPNSDEHLRINSELRSDATKGFSNSLSLMMQLMRNYASYFSIMNACAYTQFVQTLEDLGEQNMMLGILDGIDPALNIQKEDTHSTTPSP